jgi:hypothetical protein
MSALLICSPAEYVFKAPYYHEQDSFHEDRGSCLLARTSGSKITPRHRYVARLSQGLERAL